MKLILLSVLIALCPFFVHAQQQIKLEEVKQHIGDSVTVCGKVFSGRYLESSKDSPTLINLGASFPNQLLTVVIFGETRKQFTGQPENDWMQKEICVTGRITVYKDKPQILIGQASQVKMQ